MYIAKIYKIFKENKFMGNCESRPGTLVRTIKLVRLRRTTQIIAWEFIPGRVVNVYKHNHHNSEPRQGWQWQPAERGVRQLLAGGG